MALVPADTFEFGPWAVGDIVVGPATVPYEDNGAPADFTDATLSDGTLYAPDGASSPLSVTVNPADPGALDYLLTGAPFEAAGVWAFAARVAPGEGSMIRLASAPFVVENLDGWATLAGTRAQWRDASHSDVVLWRLLEVAKTQVLAWAPPPPELAEGETPPPPPEHYVLAQLTQARNVWNAVKSDPANQGIGDEGLIIRPFPMDWTVKNLIRPQRARPTVA